MQFEFSTDKEIEIRKYKSIHKIHMKGGCFKNGESSHLSTEDICVTVEKANKDFSNRVFVVQKLNRMVDDSKLSSNPIENFFIKSAEPMYKLNLMLTKDGKINKLLNLTGIKEKWAATKIYLERGFVGDNQEVSGFFESHINSFDEFYNNDNVVFNSIHRDLFYDFYFGGYWCDYGSNGSINRKHFFPNLSNEDLIFDERITLELENGNRMISINGLLSNDEINLKSLESLVNQPSLRKEDLSIKMNSKCLFDEVGLPIDIKLLVELQIANFDFFKNIEYNLKIK